MRGFFHTFILILLFASTSLWSQSNSFFKFEKGEAEIPFVIENGFIMVEVTMDWKIPLRFIFDTGAEHTIITQKEIAEILELDLSKKFQVMGADLSQVLNAYLVKKTHMKMGGLTASYRPVLVLDEDYFKLAEISGVNVHGI